WPDLPGSSQRPGGVVLLSAEDDLADTIRVRLDAAGADCERVVALQAVKNEDGKGGRKISRSIDLTRHRAQVEQAMDEVGNCRLLIIDPISAHLGATDGNSNSEVRALLAELAELAA